MDLSLDEDDYTGTSSRLVNDKSQYDKLDDDYGGAAMMEGVVAVWQKWDKYLFVAGLALLVLTLQVSSSRLTDVVHNSDIQQRVRHVHHVFLRDLCAL